MSFRKKERVRPQSTLKLKQLEESGQLRKPKPKKRRTLEQKTAQQLIPEADKWYSRYIRLRDSSFNGSEWVGPCIDMCGRTMVVRDSDGKWKQGADNGHYVSRGVHSLRFNEFNTNLQSSYCNAWDDKQRMIEGYERGLSIKYGEDTVTELKQLAKAPDAYRRAKKPELLQIIADSKAYVSYALSHPENYYESNHKN